MNTILHSIGSSLGTLPPVMVTSTPKPKTNFPMIILIGLLALLIFKK